MLSVEETQESNDAVVLFIAEESNGGLVEALILHHACMQLVSSRFDFECYTFYVSLCFRVIIDLCLVS